MSKTFLDPAGDHLLVVDNPRETTLDGIAMPDNVRQQEMAFGIVVFAGPLALNTKPTDLVCYGPYAGKTVVLDGVEFRIIVEGQIEAYVRKTD
jgi:co-chaperonin GroES (HSP10)